MMESRHGTLKKAREYIMGALKNSNNAIHWKVLVYAARIDLRVGL